MSGPNILSVITTSCCVTLQFLMYGRDRSVFSTEQPVLTMRFLASFAL